MGNIKLHRVSRLGLKNVSNSNNIYSDEYKKNVIPVISFKEKIEKIEINKTTLIKLLISGEKRYGNNNLKIQLTAEDKNLSFTTTKWNNVDYGFTLLTKVTAKESGNFKITFKVDGELTNSLYIDVKYDSLIEPEIIKDKKVTYTEEQKAKIIATIYGESDGDVNLMVNIPWIYFNLTKRLGFEKGLRRSSFYRNPNNNKWITESYRICMYYLGQGEQYKDYSIVNGMKVKDYSKESNPHFVNNYKHNLDLIRSFFENNIFDKDSILNPYHKWEGQGYWGDMNFRINNSQKTKWAKASQYLHLQRKGYVKHRYVKEFIAYNRRGKDVTTYLIDDKNIEKYFKNNLGNLPAFVNNDYSTIPRVHIPKNK